MSDRKMYFGNRYYMQWIACPETGSEGQGRGFQVSGQYLNGGAFNRQTFNAAKTRTLSWALNARDVIRPVTDYVEGVYGEGAIYWLDPFDADKNMLAQSFATPALGAYDAIVLNGSKVRPQVVPTGANAYGYPKESAVYQLGPNDTPFKHWIPVPAGYTAWVGIHGDASSTVGLTVRTKSSTTNVPVLPVSTSQRFNASFPITQEQDGVELSLESATNATLIVAGIMVQVLPTGQMPETGGFISGQGHAGMDFDGYPTLNRYSAALDLVSLSARFVETEQWK